MYGLLFGWTSCHEKERKKTTTKRSTKSEGACSVCVCVCVCVRACVRVRVCACKYACFLARKRSMVFASIALVVLVLEVWTAVYLTSYSDYLTSFLEPLLPPYSCRTSLKVSAITERGKLNNACRMWNIETLCHDRKPFFASNDMVFMQNLCQDGSSFTWHQPCQRCKYTTSVDIQKHAIKIKLVTPVEAHASERIESAQERRIALYKSDQQQQPRTTTISFNHHLHYHHQQWSHSTMISLNNDLTQQQQWAHSTTTLSLNNNLTQQ